MREIGQEPVARWADPAQADISRTLGSEYGISLSPANKRVQRGILAVLDRLALDATDRPHLVVHDRCRDLIGEIPNYVYDDDGKPRKKHANDHACDALRYMVMGVNAGYPLGDLGE